MPDTSLADALRALADVQDFDRAAHRLGLDRAALADVLREGADAVAFGAPKAVKERQQALPLAKVPEALPPALDYSHLVVFSDGAARSNPGPAGAGAVVKLPNGKIVARVGKFLGVQTNNVAEYQGVIIGLKKALDLGARKIDLRADSMLAIMQLRGEWKLKHPGLKPYFDEARALLRQFDDVSIEHVRREFNADADEMSNRAIDEEM